jgi:hypothetical protein
MPRTYEVDTCWGHPDRLRELVRNVGKQSGRIVSVTWNPDCTIKDAARDLTLNAQYVVVSEYGSDA